MIEEEIGKLPDSCRASVVCCYLEGRSYDQAAHELGMSKTTLFRRLTKARELLRRRLERRGVGIAAAALAAALGDLASAASLPALLSVQTVKA